MNWSPKQQAALDDVAAWQKDTTTRRPFVLFGYAGTGKTELARHFAAGLETTFFATFTGKAAQVLKNRGVPAQTIHSLFYSPQGGLQEQIDQVKLDLTRVESESERIRLERILTNLRIQASRPRFSFNPETAAADADLVVLDESSMIDERMARDIMGACKKVLFLGDPAQLPPVKSASYFMDLEPDVVLTEIHRQAADNPILQLAWKARMGERIPHGDWGRAKHVKREELSLNMLLEYDQVIAGYNKTRRNLNVKLRKLMNRDARYPTAGDKLICLKNNRELGLFNGMQGVALEDAEAIDTHLRIVVEMESGVKHEWLKVWRTEFDSYHQEVAPLSHFEMRDAQVFDYAYAVTAHKAQGSQWPKVAVCDDGFGLGRDDRHRWLYTAITRAQNELIIAS